MASFLWKGNRLERRLGGAWFLYLLSVLLPAHRAGPIWLLQAWLTKLIQEPDPLWDLIDAPRLTAASVLRSQDFLIGHLSGILVGLLYTLGPLRIIMETCAESVSSDMNDPRPSTYFNFSGHSGTGPESPQNAEDRTAEDCTAEDRTAEDRTAEDRTAEDRTAEDCTAEDCTAVDRMAEDCTAEDRMAEDCAADDSSDYIKTDLDRMTEEEQIELAIRNSLNDRGPTRRRRTAQPPSGFHPTEEEEEASPEEIRRRRLRRLEEEFYHQRRRRHFLDL
ncbi:rhomboid-related protein 4-like [Larimichthys crocea]|uniref:rhomboid-related protein 4-like n=1 Tax=Larimichthys crocea TaxID=215358 RepID=UPI000F5DD62F|nr:rhomboid-related protein 4-like [Larimichthys crocea]